MSTVNVPQRNKAVKKLLQATYPDAKISVTAGNGTAYHWIMIEFDRRVELPAGMTHNSVQAAIEDLIIGAGIYVSTYSSDVDFTGRCITINMPRERKEDTMRAMVREVVFSGLIKDFPNASATKTSTTSDCPMVHIKMASGDEFNITITRARK